MTENKLGQNSPLLFGQAIDAHDKPSDHQAGEVCAEWYGHNHELDDKDLPPCKVINGTDSHGLMNMGGPGLGIVGKNDPNNNTGKGTHLVGVLVGEQDVMIIGTMHKHGDGDTDGQFKPNSDLPTQAKDDRAKGQQSGDKNHKADNESVLTYAKKRGGPNQKPSKFSDLSGSFGMHPTSKS